MKNELHRVYLISRFYIYIQYNLPIRVDDNIECRNIEVYFRLHASRLRFAFSN